ncbi:MAG: P27 family phage terminase small subunit [Pseudomonadota bacterium]
MSPARGALPPVPDHITGNQAVAWAAIVRTIGQVRSVTEADVLKIEAAASAWSRWRAMEDQIAKLAATSPLAGELGKGSGGTLQVSAMRQSASAAFAEFRQFTADLGVDEATDLASIDLFGYPDRPGRGMKGRPRYIASIRDRNRVRLLLALGWNNQRIADALEISLPTLRREFKVELKERDKMRDRLDARRLELAMEQANGGNIAALRELGKLIEKQDIAIEGNVPRAPTAAEAKPGKKELAEAAAHAPPTDWETILEKPRQSH